jgi:hypothetical protein
MDDAICFEYLYRDRGNYKSHGVLLLLGSSAMYELDDFKKYLNGGEWFIAEQVGIPVLYEELWKLSDGPTEDDHSFHEFSRFREAIKSDIEVLEPFCSVHDFVKRFKKIDNRWDVSFSQSPLP